MRIWKELPLGVRVASAFFVFGIVWIVASDGVVHLVAQSEFHHAQLQTYKGITFIALSSLFIGWLVHSESRRRTMIRRLLDEIVELAPTPVVIQTYSEGRIVEANEEFAEAVDLPLQELENSPIASLDTGLVQDQHEALRERVIDTGEVSDYRQTIEADSGRDIELLVSCRRIQLGPDDLVCTVANDITELEKAYDEAIQGWARALELRDDETFAHTLRVTRGTVELARQVGIDGDDLVHIRRGALLHDIGKIGVPDSILLKDGDLTDEEWKVVRKHPVFAKELLAPIEYLQPAVDIPYSHHEKWDGSGYPQGLEAKQIPMAARIFAVVDVWDALRSDRPYRDAWEPQRVLELLEEDKGSHFQPEIVDAFFDLGKERRSSLREVESTSILVKTAAEAGPSHPG